MNEEQTPYQKPDIEVKLQMHKLTGQISVHSFTSKPFRWKLYIKEMVRLCFPVLFVVTWKEIKQILPNVQLLVFILGMGL